MEVSLNDSNFSDRLRRTHLESPCTNPRKMADAAGAQAPPTFKLVLVGDGGTGKVRLLKSGPLQSKRKEQDGPR